MRIPAKKLVKSNFRVGPLLGVTAVAVTTAVVMFTNAVVELPPPVAGVVKLTAVEVVSVLEVVAVVELEEAVVDFVLEVVEFAGV